MKYSCDRRLRRKIKLYAASGRGGGIGIVPCKKAHKCVISKIKIHPWKG